MPYNTIEKIIRAHVSENEAKNISVGDYVAVKPKHVMTHDNTAEVIVKFKTLKAGKIYDTTRPVIVLDHASPAPNEKLATSQKEIREFLKTNGIKNFYDVNRGVCHQVLPEEGFVLPGSLILGSDSHTTTYGAFNALGIPVVRTDATVLWATGKTWLQVPKTIKVILKGKLQECVMGKDIILHIIGKLGADYAINKAVEYHGDAIAQLSISDRMTIANMTVEMGGIAGVFPYDNRTDEWFNSNEKIEKSKKISLRKIAENFKPDEDAKYSEEITFDLTGLVPQVASPHSLENVTPVIEVAGIKIDQGVIGTCTNGRLEDIEIAAKILKDKKISKDVRLIIIPASNEIYQKAIQKGYIETLVSAGAVICNPNCGPCLGQHQGILAPGEVVISTSNRNFQGRMGSRDSRIYLANPATVAASAINGEITSSVEEYNGKIFKKPSEPVIKKYEKKTKTRSPLAKVGHPLMSHLKGESSPQRMTKKEKMHSALKSIIGRVVLIPEDNINTDGIYAGKHTYVSKTREEMAKVAMENYDPEFVKKIKPNDILVSGNNFGCGSSREQAVTCLQANGVRAVIAKSFSDTYYRNAINNGFLIIECPEFVEKIKSEFNKKERTITTEKNAEMDFENSSIIFDGKRYAFVSIPRLMQEIILKGGIINYIDSGGKF